MSCESEIVKTLRLAQRKVTPQRLSILSFVRHASGHLTVPEILAEIHETYPYVDASTVYRTLASAKNLGMISETVIGSGDHQFEWLAQGSRHHHLICSVCAEATILPDELVRVFATSISTELNFEIDRDHFAVVGICEKCYHRAREK